MLLSPFFIGFRSSTTFLKSYHSGDSQIYPLNFIKRHVISLLRRDTYIVNLCVCLLFLQTHRETDRFFAGSGVQLA